MPAAPRKSIATAATEEPPSKVQKVQAAFSLIQDYPASAKEMLLAGLPYAGGAKHHWQGEVFDMTGEALAKGQAQAEEKHAACKQATTEVEERIAAQDDKMKAVSDDITAASDECKKREEELQRMQAKIERAQKELATVKKETGRVWPALAKLEKEEEEIKTWHEKDIGGQAMIEEDIQSFQAYLTKLKVEPALVASVYNALMKNPDDRGAFDGVTVKATLQYLSEKTTALESRRSDTDVACDDARALLLGAQAMLDVADETEANGQVAHAEAREICAGLDQKLKAERKAADNLGKELAASNQARNAAEQEVQLFTNAKVELAEFRKGVEESQSESNAQPEAA